MANTQRTRAQLIALFADNVTGQIGAQDLRDFLVTLMETPEFTYAGDFFNGPVAEGIITDKTTRGYHLYSQTLHADYSASFGMPLAYTGSGTWVPADIMDSGRNPARGIPADSYASGATDMKILVKGIIYDNGLSRFESFAGKPVYLQSAATANSASIDVASTNSDPPLGIIGYVLGSITVTYPSVYKWHFDGTGNWAVTGV